MAPVNQEPTSGDFEDIPLVVLLGKVRAADQPRFQRVLDALRGLGLSELELAEAIRAARDAFRVRINGAIGE